MWLIVCFLGAIDTRERLFVEDFKLDGKEILSMNSDLNENTTLWKIKNVLPWNEPNISDLRRSLDGTCLTHIGKDTFRARSTGVMSA